MRILGPTLLDSVIVPEDNRHAYTHPNTERKSARWLAGWLDQLGTLVSATLVVLFAWDHGYIFESEDRPWNGAGGVDPVFAEDCAPPQRRSGVPNVPLLAIYSPI